MPGSGQMNQIPFGNFGGSPQVTQQRNQYQTSGGPPGQRKLVQNVNVPMPGQQSHHQMQKASAQPYGPTQGSAQNTLQGNRAGSKQGQHYAYTTQ